MLNFYTDGLIYACFQSILSLGLNVQYGLTGLLNLAYIGFMATGAYICAVVVLPKATLAVGTTYILGLHLPFFIGILAGMAGAGVLALVVGIVILGRKLEAEYFAILSLVIVVALSQVASQEAGIFNGIEGLISIPQPLVTSLSSQGFEYFYLGIAFLCLAIVYVVCERLRRSPLGRTLRSIREDEVAAQVFGKNVFALKLRAFVIGAVVAGLGGSLTVLYVGAFAPSGWTVSETIFALTCVFVGGAGNMTGSVVASFFVVLCVQSLQNIPGFAAHPGLLPQLQLMLIGLLLLGTLAFRPQGLLPERLARLRTSPLAAGQSDGPMGPNPQRVAGTGGLSD
jgi:branched-chain amino acid transport system permease protein